VDEFIVVDPPAPDEYKRRIPGTTSFWSEKQAEKLGIFWQETGQRTKFMIRNSLRQVLRFADSHRAMHHVRLLPKHMNTWDGRIMIYVLSGQPYEADLALRQEYSQKQQCQLVTAVLAAQSQSV